jgi:hypothetical protein
VDKVLSCFFFFFFFFFLSVIVHLYNYDVQNEFFECEEKEKMSGKFFFIMVRAGRVRVEN